MGEPFFRVPFSDSYTDFIASIISAFMCGGMVRKQLGLGAGVLKKGVPHTRIILYFIN